MSVDPKASEKCDGLYLHATVMGIIYHSIRKNRPLYRTLYYMIRRVAHEVSPPFLPPSPSSWQLSVCLWLWYKAYAPPKNFWQKFRSYTHKDLPKIVLQMLTNGRKNDTVLCYNQLQSSYGIMSLSSVFMYIINKVVFFMTSLCYYQMW
jgi:hypothetical protein